MAFTLGHCFNMTQLINNEKFLGKNKYFLIYFLVIKNSNYFQIPNIPSI